MYRNVSLLWLCVFLLGVCQNFGDNASRMDADLDAYLSILFFDENLAAIAERLENVSTDWAQNFRDAEAYVQEANSQQATQILQSMAENTALEIGLRLLAWNGLRELGVRPSDTSVYGYVVEVPVEDNWTDILVVYNDGRLRYINGQVGLNGLFVWENYDTSHPLNQEAIHTIELAQPTIVTARSIPEHLHTVPADIRITLLTFDGLKLIEFTPTTYTADVQALWEAITALFVSVVQTSAEQ